jgi:hypothetical protein
MKKPALKSLFREMKGAAMVEMTFVLPLLFFLGFGTLEFTRAFRSGETLSMVSLEAAKTGYKRCRNLAAPQLRTCLEGVFAEVQSFANLAIPHTEIILSAYRYDPLGTPKVRRIALVGVIPDFDTSQPGPPRFVQWTPAGNYETKFTEQSVEEMALNKPGGRPATLSVESSTLIISEAFHRQDVISPAPFIWHSRRITLYETSRF